MTWLLHCSLHGPVRARDKSVLFFTNDRSQDEPRFTSHLFSLVEVSLLKPETGLMDFPCVAAFQTASPSGCCALARGCSPHDTDFVGRPVLLLSAWWRNPLLQWQPGLEWASLGRLVSRQPCVAEQPTVCCVWGRETRCLLGALLCGCPRTPGRCPGPTWGLGCHGADPGLLLGWGQAAPVGTVSPR